MKCIQSRTLKARLASLIAAFFLSLFSQVTLANEDFTWVDMNTTPNEGLTSAIPVMFKHHDHLLMLGSEYLDRQDSFRLGIYTYDTISEQKRLVAEGDVFPQSVVVRDALFFLVKHESGFELWQFSEDGTTNLIKRFEDVFPSGFVHDFSNRYDYAKDSLATISAVRDTHIFFSGKDSNGHYSLWRLDAVTQEIKRFEHASNSNPYTFFAQLDDEIYVLKSVADDIVLMRLENDLTYTELAVLGTSSAGKIHSDFRTFDNKIFLNVNSERVVFDPDTHSVTPMNEVYPTLWRVPVHESDNAFFTYHNAGDRPGLFAINKQTRERRQVLEIGMDEDIIHAFSIEQQLFLIMWSRDADGQRAYTISEYIPESESLRYLGIYAITSHFLLGNSPVNSILQENWNGRFGSVLSVDDSVYFSGADKYYFDDEAPYVFLPPTASLYKASRNGTEQASPVNWHFESSGTQGSVISRIEQSHDSVIVFLDDISRTWPAKVVDKSSGNVRDLSEIDFIHAATNKTVNLDAETVQRIEVLNGNLYALEDTGRRESDTGTEQIQQSLWRLSAADNAAELVHAFDFIDVERARRRCRPWAGGGCVNSFIPAYEPQEESAAAVIESQLVAFFSALAIIDPFDVDRWFVNNNTMYGGTRRSSGDGHQLIAVDIATHSVQVMVDATMEGMYKFRHINVIDGSVFFVTELSGERGEYLFRFNQSENTLERISASYTDSQYHSSVSIEDEIYIVRQDTSSYAQAELLAITNFSGDQLPTIDTISDDVVGFSELVSFRNSLIFAGRESEKLMMLNTQTRDITVIAPTTPEAAVHYTQPFVFREPPPISILDDELWTSGGVVEGIIRYGEELVNLTINTAPQLPTIDDIVMSEGEALTLDVSETLDAEGDDLTFNWDTASSGILVISENDSSVVTITAQEVSEDTSTELTISASDGFKQSTLAITLTVTNQEPPVPPVTPEPESRSSGGSVNIYALILIALVCWVRRFFPGQREWRVTQFLAWIISGLSYTKYAKTADD